MSSREAWVFAQLGKLYIFVHVLQIFIAVFHRLPQILK